MDRNQFDALARLLATTGSRRATLGALIGVGLLGQDPSVFAKRRKGNGKGKGDKGKGGNGKDKGNDTSHGGREVQGEGRKGSAHKAHHKQTQRQRRKQRDRQDRGGDQKRGVCCGATRQCAPPEPGSTRADCDFARQSFAGQDLNGSTFRRIDGGGANFDETDNHGSDFAAACLREATFRGANLAGATWDGACLFAVDFTDADLGGDPEALNSAVLCATILPDGTRSDRDCDRSSTYSCCLPPPGGGGGGGQPCTTKADCPDEKCRTKACTGGECAYTPVGNGPDPAGSCPHCCRGGCCDPGITSCNPSGQCCGKNCAGKACGPDGCGTGGTCGTCPAHLACNDDNGQCVCDGRGCPSGCCAGASCLPGNTDQACGTAGNTCRSCPAETACRDGRCGCTSSQACATGQECVNGHCVCTPRSCPHGCCVGASESDGGTCAPGNTLQRCGTGGATCRACTDIQACTNGHCACDSHLCESGQECVDSHCVCTPHACPNGCCATDGGECRDGNTNRWCGTGGVTCKSCADGQGCVNGACVCTPQTCPRGCCAANGTCLSGRTNQDCGFGGAPCQPCPDCADGLCSCAPDSCPDGCCDRTSPGSGFCRPGNTAQQCGHPPAQPGGASCQTCPAGQLCVDGRCACTPTSCASGQLCINGECVACSPNCPCVGQSVCTSPNDPTTKCRTDANSGATCYCMVSRTGHPICAGVMDFVPACETDADCQGLAPGAVCVNAVPGAPICGTAGNFCAAPCQL